MNALQEMFQRMEGTKGSPGAVQVCMRAGANFEPAGPVRPGFENRSSPWWCCGRPLVRSAACRGAEDEASRASQPAAPSSTPALPDNATHPYVILNTCPTTRTAMAEEIAAATATAPVAPAR